MHHTLTENVCQPRGFLSDLPQTCWRLVMHRQRMLGAIFYLTHSLNWHNSLGILHNPVSRLSKIDRVKTGKKRLHLAVCIVFIWYIVLDITSAEYTSKYEIDCDFIRLILSNLVLPNRSGAQTETLHAYLGHTFSSLSHAISSELYHLLRTTRQMAVLLFEPVVAKLPCLNHFY